jgi:hypothetical protein
MFDATVTPVGFCVTAIALYCSTRHKLVTYMDERKTNLMHLLYIFTVAVGDALHVSGVFAHRQER